MERAFFIKGLAALGAAGMGLDQLGISQSRATVAGTGQMELRTYQDDWEKLKKHFSLPNGYRYFNTAGIGAVPIRVREEVDQYWTDSEVHPRPGHDEGNWLSVKKILAQCIGVGENHDHIALTNSATEGINIILNGLDWKEGDEIITSTHEHPALHVPLINIAQRKGLVIRTFEPDLDHGLNNSRRIFELASSRTRLVFISLVTCTTGQWLPVDEIVTEAHKRGILVALDGAQATGTRPLNLLDWKVDFYTSGGQKWLLGPKRTGLLFINPKSLHMIRPTTVGAYSEEMYDISKTSLAWAAGAGRFEYATQNDSNFFGLRKSVEFLLQLGLQQIQDHNESLAEQFMDGLKLIPNATVFSPGEKAYRTSIISFGLKHMDFKDLASELSRLSFRVRVVTEAGLGAVRVAIHLYNSSQEIEDLIQAVDTLSRKN